MIPLGLKGKGGQPAGIRRGGGLFSYVDLNERVPARRPLRVANGMLLLLANHSRGIIQERSIDPDAGKSTKRVA